MTEQRIIIVGGVAGGMSAAARMRRLDENSQITVLERGPYVSFANCGLPYYVGGEITDESALLVQTPAGLEASLNLDVRPHHDVVSIDSKLQTVTANTPDGPVTLAYDQLILAPGAVAVRPPIPGIDHPAVTALQTVDEATALVQRLGGGAKSAVVLGAGFIGLEAAEALQRRGLAVTVVELAPHVLPPLETELAYLVTAELRRLGLTVRAGVSAQQISDQAGQAVVSLSDGDSVTADIVVVAAGVRPDTALAEAAGVVCERGAIVVDEHGRTNLPHIWAAGDATLSQDAVTGARRPVMLAGPANRAGRLVADAIAADTSGRSARPIPRPLGTAIVRVGELTAALTGANRASLTAAGRAFTTLHLHPQDHAGYFPGAEQMHLVVHLDPATGQLLGAQGVGPAGVDKRIDILATA
ncbi:MAG: FAD-dependent oxidoreductase, partial [Propionibacteriaceae bacterium]|nr:FAD-dependent oxidoreductase [Propionibacteriaceae bacterium]